MISLRLICVATLFTNSLAQSFATCKDYTCPSKLQCPAFNPKTKPDQPTCEGKGCCWLLNASPQCFVCNKTNLAAPSILEETLIQPPEPPFSGLAPMACGNPPASSRKDCGHSGTTQQQCEASGCCWSPLPPNEQGPWCFHPNGPAPKPTPKPTVTPGACPGLSGCDVYHDNQCSGKTIITPSSFAARRWFTPRRGARNYMKTFQDYSDMAGWAQLIYTPTRDSVTVVIHANVSKDVNMNTLEYIFDGVSQKMNYKKYSKGTSSQTVKVSIHDPTGNRQIALEPIDFQFNAIPIKQRPGDYRSGQKGGIVEMFGWPHADIEKECSFLASAGYMGVKVFPPQEQVLSYEPFQNYLNPWYFMYQPVSYKLDGRMGSRDALRKMISTCRGMGVRVYADAVVNHMSGGGNDANPYHRNPGAGCTTWGAKNSSLALWNGNQGSSPWYTQSFVYTCSNVTKLPPSQEFPAAGYGPTDFHCERALNSWTDPLDLNAGWLTGLVDLNTEKDNVQERIAGYMTDILSIGFSGFRVDAAKHIQPPDLAKIFNKLRRNMGGSLPDDFISWLEVLLGGESDLLMCNANSGYNFGIQLANELAAGGMSKTDIDKIKIWNSGYPKETDKGVCTITKVRSAIQNDDADQQTPGSSSRDMGNTGCVLVKGCDPAEHRGFEVKLFTNPNGATDNDNDFPIRLVLSSYYWANNNVMGMPDGLSDCKLCQVNCDSCQGMSYSQAYDASSTGYDKPVYTRVHRDSAIIAAMKSWMHISSSNVTVSEM